jgi:hypothetical protein
LQGVLAEAAAESLAPAVLGHHVARVGHMGSQRERIGPEVVEVPTAVPAAPSTATITTWLCSTHATWACSWVMAGSWWGQGESAGCMDMQLQNV